MNKKYSYIGITFIILLFGIYTVPKIVSRFQDADLVEFGKVPDFEFTDQVGATITNKNYDGKVYVLEFFFSTCPSICPIMNQKMVTIQDAFFGNPEFGIASISITPEIDTPEVLKEYARNKGITHKNWHLLTGRSEEFVFELSNEGFKLPVGKGVEAHGGFYHSGLFALIDKEGIIRSRKDEYGNPIMYYRALEEQDFPDQIKELKEDIKLLLNE
ncbi:MULTISPECIES: SCO family protein [unclassified Polaribacter]|uniref:SCO family protein n=1 Tax=unclassified Polaribacter TaxID=196858 RepID=UPI0011BF3363|nr:MULTISPECIES: SCO family protein [unclassified Polaribacter]TXD54080.1 SCO family protein [Polaribacter sp. IC063]TXD62596.1 SCO family protein [Polaribacter sp. IC066]